MINKYSVKFLWNWPNKNKILLFYKYCLWQFIKLLNLFPRTILVSKSVFNITNKKVAEQGAMKLYCVGIYDYDNICFIRDYLSSNINKIFFDVGANMGVYSLLISEDKQIKVYAFEPHPITHELLKQNIIDNQRTNIFSKNMACSDINGKMNFENNMYSSLNKLVDNSANNTIQVDSIRLDKFVEDSKIVPLIVKIDVEGAEYEVLKGLGREIEKTHIIICEENKDNRVIDLLKNKFRGPFYVDFKNKTISTTKHYCEDPVFINKKYIDTLSVINYKLIITN